MTLDRVYEMYDSLYAKALEREVDLLKAVFIKYRDTGYDLYDLAEVDIDNDRQLALYYAKLDMLDDLLKEEGLKTPGDEVLPKSMYMEEKLDNAWDRYIYHNKFTMIF